MSSPKKGTLCLSKKKLVWIDEVFVCVCIIILIGKCAQVFVLVSHSCLNATLTHIYPGFWISLHVSPSLFLSACLDVKPSNVLINMQGQVKMCDFGISGYLVDSVAKTMDAGCKPYMAVSLGLVCDVEVSWINSAKHRGSSAGGVGNAVGTVMTSVSCQVSMFTAKQNKNKRKKKKKSFGSEIRLCVNWKSALFFFS